MKILLGLIPASRGEARIFGRPSGERGAREAVGFLPEAPYFHRYMSGLELVAYYGKLCGLRGRDARQRADAVLKLVGLEAAADRRVGTYSKGMLQRVGLAQALVHDPRLVVLDEPTAGVDPVGSAAIGDIVRELKRRGVTVLLCSHLLAQMAGLCDRGAILHRGRVVRSGRVEDLLGQPGAEVWHLRGLDVPARERVLQALRAEGGELLQRAHPRRSLDELFLEAVGEGSDREEAGRD